MLLSSKHNGTHRTFFDKQYKYEIRHRALLEAIRFCGGVASYSQQIKVSRSRASNWLNQPKLNIPYEYVILTEDVTQVSIERLSPFTELTNKVIRGLLAKDKLRYVEMLLDEILIDPVYLSEPFTTDQPIIVGTDRVLIWGLAQLQAQKADGLKKALVLALDLGALLLNMRSINDLKVNFLLSQEIAIGLRLERLLCKSEQLEFLDLKEPSLKDNKLYLCVVEKIAKILGLSCKEDYLNARQVCLCGIPELIDALNKKQISIEEAATVAHLAKDKQRDFIQTRGVKLL